MARVPARRSRDALERAAWSAVGEMWFAPEHQHRFHEACAVIDVSPPQLKALLSLEPGEGQPMRSLAEGWRCDASWVTGIVDALEERGYVARLPHPRDRRVKVVEITPLGAKAKASALEKLYEPPAGISALTDEELHTLAALLERVRAGP